MADLNAQLQALADPEPGTGFEATVTSGGLTLAAPTPFLQTEADGIHIRPSPAEVTFAAVLLDSPVEIPVVVPFNFLRAPGPLGRVFAEVIGPGGDIHHPTLDGLSAKESAPGGFQSMTGRIPERILTAHPEVYRQDARALLYLESDATCLHGGRLNEPDRSGGAVQLSSRGDAQRADHEAIDPIVYETHDMSIWRETAPDTDDTVQDRWQMRTREINRFRGEVEALSFEGPGAEGGVSATAWLPGRDLARIAFRADAHSVSSQNGIYIIITSGKLPFSYDETVDGDTPDLQFNWVNWEGGIGATPGDWVIDIDVDLSVFFTPGDDGAGGYGDNRGVPSQAAETYPDFVSLEIGRDPDVVSPFSRVSLDLIDVRLYGAGGPLNYGDRRMSPAELAIDLFGRIGIPLLDVEPSGGNVLPYEIAAGTPYSDGLDFAALLMNRPWVIRHNGHRAYGAFVPWDQTTWRVASPHAKIDVTGTNRFNAAVIPFLYKDGSTPGTKTVRADPDFLDHRSFFGQVALENPARSDERAEDLGQAIMAHFATPQIGAMFDVGEVHGETGPTSGQHVFAGHTLDGRPSGRPGDLKVVSLERGYDFVRGQCGVDTSSGASTGHPALDRMIARRQQRLST